MPTPADFDAIVVGTGFAGAVTACRLAEAGLKICVLERGRRYEKDDFPRYPTNDLVETQDDTASANPGPDFSRWLWARDQGLFDIRDLEDAVTVQAAGYGGGSLIYANVHLRPPRDVFSDRWPDAYRDGALDPYFDLAAYMLRVTPIPHRLAKTLQFERGARAVAHNGDRSWFRPPLAITFNAENGVNPFGRPQEPCDMRGRCCVGCDRQAKNTLDLNYLARAEGDGAVIRTLAEVQTIERDGTDLVVIYRDWLSASGAGTGEPPTQVRVRAPFVFLCAGAVNTTELLLRNPQVWDPGPPPKALGSHYFPNAGSLAAVFQCDEPHEADYGPTITSAVLCDTEAEGSFSRSLDFLGGRTGTDTPPPAGTRVTGRSSGATALLAHEPVLDWGSWKKGDAAGALVLECVEGTFRAGEELKLGAQATAIVRFGVVSHRHWFLAQDGGYPPDLEPLLGIFRSPLWLRRNRFIETRVPTAHELTPRRPATQRLRFGALSDALGGTARLPADGIVGRAFNTSRESAGAADIANTPLHTLLPDWFMEEVQEQRKAFVAEAAALALPMFSRLLDDLAERAAGQLDEGTLSRFRPSFTTGLSGISAEDPRKDVFIRGMLRQALQVLGGSEVEIAARAAKVLLDPIPETPNQLLRILGDVLLWVLAYEPHGGNTGVILTMGRDLYRGRLRLDDAAGNGSERRLRVELPTGVLDTHTTAQERALRTMASRGFHGELRTNPAWSALGRKITVHSQGGSPMGPNDGTAVTDASGRVHGCRNLFVMDAAAFPTSVGVNPSATIAAVAEYKVEQFIKHRLAKPEWRARDVEPAREWVEPQRDVLDPLNRGTVAVRRPPRLRPIGLTFKEVMRGFVTKVESPGIDPADLGAFPSHLSAFRTDETAGMLGGPEGMIELSLLAAVSDLRRLVRTERTSTPLHVKLHGRVTRGGRTSRIRDGSLRLFVAPSQELTPLVRYFAYTLSWREPQSGAWTFTGLKVLSNDAGQDVWTDTTTLYSQLSNGAETYRGVLRMSFDDFLRKQLPSMKVSGTVDRTRMTWALTAFYKYFARELVDIYASRADMYLKLIAAAAATVDA